ncbi:hypothetical protein FCM35_KLT18199 [Carex littledalei]|uniref:Uncharacterized protein n=1 Tax=Carex littledalei TaxID=544730 RepID=A0A833REV4_9POAL|nr:hypothetical protein FCM35_KLT18199 [Carex littledalei]
MVGPTVHAREEGDCFCPCMKDQCMNVKDASKEECATACDRTCTSLAYAGQPNKQEFCGF